MDAMMTYALLKFAHVLGAVLIGGGLISVWLSDLRSRQLRELPQFSEAVQNIAVFYDGVVVPGALLLLVSGIKTGFQNRVRAQSLRILEIAVIRPFVSTRT